jgi:hypothetical protein
LSRELFDKSKKNRTKTFIALFVKNIHDMVIGVHVLRYDSIGGVEHRFALCLRQGAFQRVGALKAEPGVASCDRL